MVNLRSNFLPRLNFPAATVRVLKRPACSWGLVFASLTAVAAPAMEGEWSATWLSAYVSEGREAWAGDATGEFFWTGVSGPLAVELNYLRALTGEGEEWGAGILHEIAWQEAVVTVGLGHVADSFAGANSADNEISLGLGGVLARSWTLTLDGVYSLSAHGHYWTATLGWAKQWQRGWSSRLEVGVSWDNGYANDAAGDWDHAHAALQLATQVGDQWTLALQVVRCHALSGIRREGGSSLWQAAISVGATF